MSEYANANKMEDMLDGLVSYDPYYSLEHGIGWGQFFSAGGHLQSVPHLASSEHFPTIFPK